jgi:hypothetical protein
MTYDIQDSNANFKEHKAMLGDCKIILEQDPRKIAINPDRFDKLITALRTAVDNDGTLDKESPSYNDIFDNCPKEKFPVSLLLLLPLLLFLVIAVIVVVRAI